MPQDTAQIANDRDASMQPAVHEWPVFAWADQAEVIRASQKDDYYVRQLKVMAEDVAEHALGGQAFSRSDASAFLLDSDVF